MGGTGNYKRLIIKGLMLLAIFIAAIVCPDILTRLFTSGIGFLKIYHLFWAAAVLVLIKRMIPRFNRKLSSGKIFLKCFKSRDIDKDDPAKQIKLRAYKRKIDSGAFRAAIYWIFLVLTMGFWRKAGILPNVWLFVIVVFFVFMDEFCVTTWCPFKAIIGNKCCFTCRINNWGYLMVFSPLVLLVSFWTYSILFLSLIVLIQWEYLYHKHPERFYELYNQNLTCRSCKTKCRRWSALRDRSSKKSKTVQDSMFRVQG